MKRVFIDGSAGTTGLRIRTRLEERADITLVTLPEALRKDPQARRESLNSADIAVLCLPDAASREAVAMVENPDTVIIDASTAHRTAPGWVYGFPEAVPESAALLPSARRIAVPGCHASGFVALIRPLVDAGILPRDAALVCHSLTGYSGGGKKMIAEYESDGRDALLGAPRVYGLSQTHKHLPEMSAVCRLAAPPAFLPVVGDFYSGMLVTVALHAGQLAAGMGAEAIREAYAERYAGPIVRYAASPDESGFLSAGALSGLDRMEVSVFGCDERIVLAARFDNLGKGASGAALECLNIALGADPAEGLKL